MYPWVNYNISLTVTNLNELRPFGDDSPIKTMIPGLGRSEVMIKFINDGSWDFSRQIRPETTQMIFMKSEGKTTYQQQASLAINLKFISSLRLNTTGWWLTYPSEKWWSSSVGMMTFPIYGKNVPNHQPNNIYWLRHRYSPRSINLSIPADGHAPLSSIVMAVPHSNGWVPKQPPCKSFSTRCPRSSGSSLCTSGSFRAYTDFRVWRTWWKQVFSVRITSKNAIQWSLDWLKERIARLCRKMSVHFNMWFPAISQWLNAWNHGPGQRWLAGKSLVNGSF